MHAGAADPGFAAPHMWKVHFSPHEPKIYPPPSSCHRLPPGFQNLGNRERCGVSKGSCLFWCLDVSIYFSRGWGEIVLVLVPPYGEVQRTVLLSLTCWYRKSVNKNIALGFPGNHSTAQDGWLSRPFSPEVQQAGGQWYFGTSADSKKIVLCKELYKGPGIRDFEMK